MTWDADVVIVGAGPIGLAHAWGIKKLNPKLRVLVFEKYSEYQRRHTLVMQPRILEQLMRATGSMDDPELKSLLEQIKKDRNIRTNALEKVFKKVCADSGVEIVNEEIKAETLEQQIFTDCPNVKLVIGADGSHSVVSKTLFPEGNQVKHEFDYVLQLRFEIDGEYTPGVTETVLFYQSMFRQGFVANEYVGAFKEGKTPVTTQMMISKEDFERLKVATSKQPIFLFKNDDDPRKNQELGAIGGFIQRYLQRKIQTLDDRDSIIDQESIRISVNEAPATHAKQVFTYQHNVPVILGGDAALGLSYFIGLNAGLESTATLLSEMLVSIESGLTEPNQVFAALDGYQNWFINYFAPKKVKEVEKYSVSVIGRSTKASHATKMIYGSSYYEEPNQQDKLIDDYFNLFLKGRNPKNDKNWKPFPHRSYAPITFGQWEYIPPTYNLSRTLKLVTDLFKPYKSMEQYYQDLRTPLTGINNLFVGIAKTVGSIVTLNLRGFADGITRTIRGAIEIATFPYSLIIKPLIRWAITGIVGMPKVESNAGIQRLVKYGRRKLNNYQELDRNSSFELLAVCNDIHRKFGKSIEKGQKSEHKELEEIELFHDLRADNIISKQKIDNYFSLFSHKKAPKELETVNQRKHSL